MSLGEVATPSCVGAIVTESDCGSPRMQVRDRVVVVGPAHLDEVARDTHTEVVFASTGAISGTTIEESWCPAVVDIERLDDALHYQGEPRAWWTSGRRYTRQYTASVEEGVRFLSVHLLCLESHPELHPRFFLAPTMVFGGGDCSIIARYNVTEGRLDHVVVGGGVVQTRPPPP